MASLFETTAEALGENLRNALQVAAGGETAVAERLSKAELARRTGLSRDTIGKLVPDREAEDAQGEPVRASNCDLRTLCAVSEHLGISPALLLMTQQDWHLLISAIAGLADWEQNAQAREEFAFRLKESTGARKVEVGLAMAHAQGFRPERIPDDPGVSGIALHELQQRLDRMNAARRRSILVTTAVAQPAARFRDELFTVTALAALVGANSKLISKGEEK